MPFDAIAPELYLPFNSKEVFSPNGAGAKVYADLANEKIGKVIEREKSVKPKVGILVANPKAKETQQIIGIICEFKDKIEQDVIDLAHKLCWNFCRSPLLIVIEPNLIRVFSCYEKPKEQKVDSTQLPFEAETEFSAPKPIYEFNPKELLSAETKSAIKALQWVELVSGNFFNKEKKHFPREQKADVTLLKNLIIIRQNLHNMGLEYDTIHDLLARIIFIQFLFDRKDSHGKSIISSEYLEQLYTEKKLSARYESAEGILNNYDDAYKFFKLLNKRFNGDLFPGDKEEDWEVEMSKVTEVHLKLLADFIGGKLELSSGQFSLWKMYSFDTIPLEFISSIYEEFVSQQQHQEKLGDSKKPDAKREKGVYYTKSHLVDFILDNVLPWDEKVWDLKILDPSCGSGIFLVKAFQRLVHRWENSLTQTEKESSNFSKKKKDKVIELLKNNLFGVDIDKHAVRVASFSLYLALCDELDPKTLWEKVTFPDLREKQVVASDFFDEDEPLFKQHKEEIKYDIIVGNAPWGDDTLTERAKSWAKRNGWSISNNSIAALFLPKCAKMLNKFAHVSLIQPITILTGKAKASEFRKKLFRDYKIEEVVNLSDLRFFLFEKAVSPPCIITMRAESPDGKSIQYICPKKRGTDEDYRQILIEPMDINFVQLNEAIKDSWIWSALMWGNHRDAMLMREFIQADSLQKMFERKLIKKKRGIERGEGAVHSQEEILERKILDSKNFPENTFLTLDSELLEPNKDAFVRRKDKDNYKAFEVPQLLLKLGWQIDDERFRAVLIKSSDHNGVISSGNYLSIHSENKSALESACLVYNSKLAVYFLLLSSGRFATYRPSVLVNEALSVPLPEKNLDNFNSIKPFDFIEVDKRVYHLFNLQSSQKILIDDLFKYTLPDFKGKVYSLGRQTTSRKRNNELEDYCKIFFKVINAGFGKDKNLRATIFQESEDKLPVRMIAIHLDFPDREELIKVDKQSNEKLSELLQELNEKFMQNQSENGNIFYERVVRIYSNDDGIPTIYIIKPDQKRYWLRSQALNDADEVSADIVPWLQQQNRINSQGAKRKKVE